MPSPADEAPALFPLEPERRARSGSPAARSRRRAPARGAGRPAPAVRTDLFCQVALDRPMRCEFTYAVPVDLAPFVAPGMRVAVPFAGRREVAVVVGLTGSTEVAPDKLKPVHDLLDGEPIVDADLLELTRWMASYYACSWGEALAAILPAALKRERARRATVFVRAARAIEEAELAELAERQPKQHRLLRTLLEASGPLERVELLRRTNLSASPLETLVARGWVELERREGGVDVLLAPGGTARPRPERLTDEQSGALARLLPPLEERRYATFLLRGVTGSGKTEVYLRLIEEALRRGRGAIVLVPEIALTPQTVSWFRSRFASVAVLHSRMTDGQRLDMWKLVRRGDARVVIGARSAVFAPVRDLGVIVVDEEHEPSFKQNSTPRYHARDVAVMRAREAGAVCVLGSATPSLESWTNIERGRYQRVELLRRVHGGSPPPIQVIDMRAELAETKRSDLFSRRLHELLAETLERKEQAILFLNRRGYSPVLWCQSCSAVVTCGSCAVPMNYHKRHGRLVCHTCCDERLPPQACPTCTSPALRYLGTGSERVEDTLRKLFPDARVGRMDSDTMLRREDYEERLGAFGRAELDVLVGTQMIAKGLDFPRVTLVGVVAADSTLHLPDFRAAERTFQLLSQVAGRTGRGDLGGRTVVQTYVPTHPAIVHAARHDYEAFAAGEGTARRELGYPPYGRLVRVVIEDREEARARGAAEALGTALTERFSAQGVRVLGPAPAPLSKVRDRFRLHLLLKAAEGVSLAAPRAFLIEAAARRNGPRVAVDVDPIGML